jgi:hypothetical protein
MSGTPTHLDHIRYDLLTQDALRSVVRRVLTDVVRSGLPGEHHFYIGFDTRAPGVRLSTRMREKYPTDITIVLQHQFWDLAVTDHAFEVGLSFGGIPERLLVPFSALRSFYDPSVQFGLEFEPITPRPTPAAAPAGVEPEPAPARPVPAAPRGAGSEPSTVDGRPAASGRTPGAVPRIAPAGRADAPAPPTGDDDEPTPPATGGADVVRLDRFRKK